MKIFNLNTHLTGGVLATLACASLLGCSNANDRTVVRDASVPPLATSNNTYATNDTTSNTTIAANDETAPPVIEEAPMSDQSAASTTTTTTETKRSKHSKMKHKAKKHHKRDSAMIDRAPQRSAVVDDDGYIYDSAPDRNVSAVDASKDYQDHAYQDDRGTESGVTTNSPVSYYENGLSPFSQEPASRMPTQIGSGQMTGEDRSTTVLDGPSLFQDPSALGRNVIK